MSEIMELIGTEDQRELDAVDEAADVKRRPGRPRKIIVEGVQPLTGKPSFVHRDEPAEKVKTAKAPRKVREKTGRRRCCGRSSTRGSGTAGSAERWTPGSRPAPPTRRSTGSGRCWS